MAHEIDFSGRSASDIERIMAALTETLARVNRMIEATPKSEPETIARLVRQQVDLTLQLQNGQMALVWLSNK
jgi:hypothetical protein